MPTMTSGREESERPPRISVVVPAHNDPGQLQQCLDALAGSRHSAFECIVVDDGSPRPLRDTIRAPGVRWLSLEENGGPARARNRGVEAARAPVVVFVDADVCVHPDTLERFDRSLAASPETAAVMGSYDDRPAAPEMVSRFRNLLHCYTHHRGNRRASTFWAGCGAIRTAVFRDLGGFDERFRKPSVEDIELGMRLRAAGHRIDLDPTIQGTHLKRWTLCGMVSNDVRQRAIPWMRLILAARSAPPDLNVKPGQRVSILLAWALLGSSIAAATMSSGRAGVAAILLIGALIVLNIDLYRFLARAGGALFALASIPLHWLYFLYCGAAIPVALLLHARDALRGESFPVGDATGRQAIR